MARYLAVLGVVAALSGALLGGLPSRSDETANLAFRPPPPPPPATDAQAVLNLFRQTGLFPPGGDAETREAALATEGSADDDPPRIVAVARRDGELIIVLSEADPADARLQPLRLGERTEGGFTVVAASGAEVIVERHGRHQTLALYPDAPSVRIGTGQ